MSRPASLGLAEKLTLVYDGKELTDAHTLSVWLSSEGRHGIKSEDFDNQQPISFDLAPARILELLGAESTPDAYLPPAAEIEDSFLNVGPGAFRPRQRVSYLLIIDGLPSLQCKAALPDVRLESFDAKTSTRLRSISYSIFVKHWWFTTSVIFGVLAAGLWIGFTQILEFVNRSSDWDEVTAFSKSFPSEDEGTWMLQVPVADLPRLPSNLATNCAPALESAVNAGAGIPVDTIRLHLDVYSFGQETSSFDAARVIIDGRSSVTNLDKLRCESEAISTDPDESTDRLLVNLDDQTVKHFPADVVDEDLYAIDIEVSTKTCFCAFHIELDVLLNGKVHTLILDKSNLAYEDTATPPPELIPFQLVGPGTGEIYDFKDGLWEAN